MSKEEIRKLLGAYSTNTLTESERSALFEAALDDQELFNALQQEQALKGLLDDPATRAQVRQALQRQPSGRQTGSRMRWWAWGGALSAATVASILLVVFRPNPLPPAAQKPVEIASLEKAPSPPAPQQPSEQQRAVVPPKERPRTPAKAAAEPAPVRDTLPAAPAAAPPPLIAAPVPPRAVGSLRQEPGALMAGRAQDQVALASAPVAKAVGGAPQPLLRYSLLKSEANDKNFARTSDAELKPGDFVRLQVSAALAGQLTLSRLDDAGQWQRLAEISALPNSSYTMPDSPIEVTATARRYRLTLEAPLPQAGIVGGIAGGPKREMRAAAQAAAAAPAVVEITIGGKPGN